MNTCKVVGGAVCVVVGILHLVLGIVAINEAGRFDPIYTPLSCTSLFLDIPVVPFLHFTPTGLIPSATHPAVIANNNTVPAPYAGLNTLLGGNLPTGADYNVMVVADGAEPTGYTPFAGAVLTGNTPLLGPLAASAAPGIMTADEYAAQRSKQTAMKCTNENQVEVVLKKTTVGDIQMFDGTNWHVVGAIDLDKDYTIPSKEGETAGTVEVHMGMKLNLGKDMTKLLLAALGAPELMAGQPVFPFDQAHPAFCAAGPAGFANGCVAPLFFTLTPKSTMTATLFGMDEAKEDKLEKSWCGVYAGAVLYPTGHPLAGTPGVQLMSQTWCKPTQAEIVAQMMTPAVGAAAAACNAQSTKDDAACKRPKKEMDEAAPMIDNMDPPKKVIDDMEGQVGTMTTLMTVAGFLIFVVCLAAGGFLIMTGMNDEGAAKGDVENQVNSAA